MADVSLWQHVITDVIPTAGVGGILALVMFYFYRADAQQNAARFETIVARQDKREDNFSTLMQDTAKTIATSTEVMRSLVRQVDRLDK